MVYVVRSELHYGPDEWKALPWQWQRAFIEELGIDGKLSEGADDDEPDIGTLAEHGIRTTRELDDE